MTKRSPVPLERRNSGPNVSQNGIVVKIEKNCNKSTDGEVNLLLRAIKRESCLIFSNTPDLESMEESSTTLPYGPLAAIIESQYKSNDNSGFCIEEIKEIKVLDANLEPISLNSIDRTRIANSIKKLESWDSASKSELVKDLASLEETGVEESKRPIAAVVVEVSTEEMKTKKQVFPLNIPPLWGFNSICGRRSEMEDSIVTLPQFMKIPSKMLSDNQHSSSIQQDLDAHVFGVYDGHGGCQVKVQLVVIFRAFIFVILTTRSQYFIG